MDWSFEEEILDALARHVKATCSQQDPEDLIICAMNTAAFVEERNSEVLGKANFNSLKVKLMSSSFVAYNYNGGACGGYTLFLARLLKKIGFKEKVVQLKVNGIWGGHMALGIEKQNKLLLIDPFFNYAFKDSTGHLCDINEIAKNWHTFHSNHLPQGYDKKFNYQSGWRFTNWDKFGFVSRSFYYTGIFIWGRSKMDNLSMRYWLLGLSRFYSLISFLGFVLFLLIAFIPSIEKRKSLVLHLQKTPSLFFDYKLASGNP